MIQRRGRRCVSRRSDTPPVGVEVSNGIKSMGKTKHSLGLQVRFCTLFERRVDDVSLRLLLVLDLEVLGLGIRSEVKVTEELKEAGANGLSKEPASHRAGAARRGKIQEGIWPGSCEVNNELNYLGHGDVFLPPDLLAESGHGIVVVHSNMNG